MPIADVRAYLEKKRAEWSAQNDIAGGGAATHEADVVIAALERSPQTFPGWLSRHLSMLEGQHARLTRHLTR